MQGISRPVLSSVPALSIHPGTIDPQGPAHGLLQIVGIGKTSLTVANRGKQATLDVRVEVNQSRMNHPANAGTAKTVKVARRCGGLLQSRDLDGEALCLCVGAGAREKWPCWTSIEPSFTARMCRNRTFRFKLA